VANPDLDRLIADHLAGSDDGEVLAELLEHDAEALRAFALQVAIDRVLRQAGAPAIDIDQVMCALPQRRSSSMPTRVLRQIAQGDARRRRRMLVPLATAAALALALLGLLTWYAPAPVTQPATMPVEQAILRSSPHAEWPHRQSPADPITGRLTTGRIDLCAGTAELELPSGAILVLQGPTVLDVTGPNSSRLLLGRLTAYVPSRASGFVLQAEGVRIVDLGTAFGLGQGVDGVADLHVFAGAVEASARIEGVDATRRLNADEAVRIDPRGGSWAMVPCDPSRFIHGLRPRGLSLDLADLAAGGDGFGTATADGLDPLSGRLATGPAAGNLRDPDHGFHAAVGLQGIDGVFIPNGREGDTVVDSTGRRFRFPQTDGEAYDLIRRGGTFDLPRHGGRPEHPGIPPIFGGIDYRAPGRTALGMHANVGMTIDLQGVAYRHPGLRVERLTAMLANVGRKGGSGRADFWLLIDGELVRHHHGLSPASSAIPIDLRLAPGQRFLTLVSTDGGNGNGLDWITLGDPRLHLVEAP
jgi:hypothetical protein